MNAEEPVSDTARSTSRSLRAAIVGTGAIAAMHAEAIRDTPGVDLVAVADTVTERASAFAERFSVATSYASLELLLEAESIDVAHICTPPGVHAHQAATAFAAGAHVVVEKPPALSLDELDGMIEAARVADRQLAIVFQQRTGTAPAHVRSLLESGALGRPLVALCNTLWFRSAEYYDVPWRGQWGTEGGGTTLGHGIHQVDLLAYLLGDWAGVQGQLWRLDRRIETEDLSTAVIRFESGVIATVVTSVLSPRETSSLRIDTEHATITVDHLYGHGHADWSITPAPHVSAAEAESWVLPDVEVASGHHPLLAAVYESLIAGAPLPEVASNPARSFEIVAAIYASADSGGLVTPQSLRADAGHRASMRSAVTVVEVPPVGRG